MTEDSDLHPPDPVNNPKQGGTPMAMAIEEIVSEKIPSDREITNYARFSRQTEEEVRQRVAVAKLELLKILGDPANVQELGNLVLRLAQGGVFPEDNVRANVALGLVKELLKEKKGDKMVAAQAVKIVINGVERGE